MEIMIGIGVFLFTLLFIYALYYTIKRLYKPEDRKVRERLRRFSLTALPGERTDILKKKILSEIPWLNRILLNISFIARLERLLVQADTPHPLGVFMLLSAALLFAGLILGGWLHMSPAARLLAGILLAATPFFYLYRKRLRRIRKFERQLPEVLELVARSLKAGHAFTGGLKMVAEEFDDPAGIEFRILLDEINFGAGIPEALLNLTKRIQCEDLKFFVVSVNIQRETGGNLAEILENLGRLIRERFKLHGRVRALSAEGRLSALILVAMPFFVAAVLSLLRPDYMGTLFSDPMGRLLVVTALIMMSVGIAVLKKMVTIKV